MGHECCRLYLLAEHGIVAVVAQPPLGIDDLALAVESFRYDAEILEAVALELEDLFEGKARKPVCIDRQVRRGIGIVCTALGLHDAIEFARLEILGAEKHHVFEKV
jgi:hypothetical protein